MKNLFLALLVFTPLVWADCAYLDVSLLDSAAVAKGVQAYYPVTLTNTGLEDVSVLLAGYCPADLDCYYSPTPSYATLSASESKTFNFVADTAAAELGAHSLSLSVSSGGAPTPCYAAALSLEVLSAPAEPTEPDSFTVELVPAGSNASGWAGDLLEFEVRVTNNEDNTGYAELELEGAFAAAASFSSTKISIAPHATKSVSLRLRIPPGTPGGVYDNSVVVGATAGGSCCEQNYALPLQTCVFADSLDIEVMGEPLSCSDAVHNEETLLELEVRNDGEITGPFRAYLHGEGLGMLSLSNPYFEVASGDRVPLTIKIAPPLGTVLDTYYYSLKIDYLGYTVYERPLCFSVSGVEDFQLDYDDEAVIRRCRVETIPVTLENNGTLFDDYEIEVEPIEGMLIQPVPSAFTLSPGQSKQVDFVFSTTLSEAPELGLHELDFTVRSRRLAKAYELPFLLVSSEAQGESFLYLTLPELNAAAGGVSQTVVRVSNTGTQSVRSVALEILGLDASLYQVESAPQDIPGSGSRDYAVSFYLPADSPDFLPVTFRAYSAADGEAVAKNASLAVMPAGAELLDLTVSDVAYDSSSKEVTVIVTVTNQGLAPVTGVKPAALTGFAVAFQPGALDLAPGETRSLTLSYGGVEAPQELAVQIVSDQGAYSRTVPLSVTPAEAPATPWLLFALVGVCLAFAAYAFIIKREKPVTQEGGEDESVLAEPAGKTLADYAEESPDPLAGKTLVDYEEPVKKKRAKKRRKKAKK